ncbi:Cys-Gln thioester bond-forming surface protein [Lagierella sp. ICN-221743]
MKKKIKKLISCLLAVVLIITILLPSVVMASEDGPEDLGVSITIKDAKDTPAKAPKSEGAGTPEDPKVTTTTTVVKDEENNETTTTVKKEKEWQDENVMGNEDSQTVETVDEDGNLISASGEAQGKETTTIKDEKDTELKVEEEIKVEDSKATTIDGKNINTDEPEVTIELKPGEEKEVTVDMNAWFDEDTLGIPDWIRQKDGDTSNWIIEDSSDEEDGSITNITITKAENSTTYTRKITTPDGKVTEEKITYTHDENGRITGYETETKETVSETTVETTPPANAEIHADGGWKELVYELPEKPHVEEPEMDENGKIKNGKVIVEIHDKNGNVAGYTEVEIRDGKVVKYSDPILGKLVSKETKVETLENGLKKYTVTKTTLTRTSGKKTSGSVSDGERTVSGNMGLINGDVVFDYDSLKTFLPDFTIAGPDGEGFNDDQDIARENITSLANYDENGQYFQWLGQLGLYSQIYIRDGDGNTVVADQFEIEGKDGKKYYAYCADLNVYAQEGAHYNMQRLEDTNYIEHKDKIRSIVLKGYWGVKNESTDPSNPSAGSLDAFRKILLDNHALTEEESNNLTHGMALLATQAAIWRYGNSGESMLGDKLEFPWGLEEPKASIINKTYKYLVGMEGTPATASNTILNKEDFATMVDLTVKEKLDDDKYNTDVKIAMAVEFDDETSDLKLYVTADGKKVDEFRIAGTLQEGEKKATKNPDGSFTLAGLALRGNRKFNINLKGVQNLKDGVYIFSCDKGPNGHPAQTLIGAGESKEDIDLNVDLEFNVKEKVNYASLESENEATTLEWEALYYTYKETSFDDHTDDTEEDDEEHDKVEETTEVDTHENQKKKSTEKSKVTRESNRNYKVPKTGDSLYQTQIILMCGALISFFAGTYFKTKKEKNNEF